MDTNYTITTSILYGFTFLSADEINGTSSKKEYSLLVLTDTEGLHPAYIICSQVLFSPKPLLKLV